LNAASSVAFASLLVCLGLPLGACGEKGDPGPLDSTAKASASATSAVPAVPAAKAICEIKSGDEHSCLELGDVELAAERENACGGAFLRDSSCPREDVLGTCRFPDGTLSFGYPPKTVALLERACQASQGRFAAGDKPPPPERVTMTSCRGKYEKACEEEEVHAAPRLKPAEDECRTFGGSFTSGTGCSRDGALATCDLKGKRTVVMLGPASADARKRFCDERGGKLNEIAPATSASASAAPAVDEDPPSPKPDAVIRVQ
jgi:hypothetical protein